MKGEEGDGESEKQPGEQTAASYGVWVVSILEHLLLMFEYYYLKGFESGNVVSQEVSFVFGYALVELSGCHGYWTHPDLACATNQDLSWECAVD